MVGSVDPRGVGELRRFGPFADEPFGVCGVGGIAYTGTLVTDRLGQAVVDVGGGVQADAGVAVFVVVPTEEVWQCLRASWIELSRPGKSGRYFSVLNRASENGLSLETCRRECD